MPICTLLAMGPVATPAQAAAPAAAPAAGKQPAAGGSLPQRVQSGPDPVVAIVEGHPILLSDVGALQQHLYPFQRSLPFQLLYPRLLDHLIDQAVLAAKARREGLDNDPAIQHQMAEAGDAVLAAAMRARLVTPDQIDEAALHARYEQTIAGKPGPAEVHIFGIVQPTQAAAQAVLDALNAGTDFATEARKVGVDPSAASGGDMGFQEIGKLAPTIAGAVAALPLNKLVATPVPGPMGWYVVKVTERRQAPTPTYEEARPALRTAMTAEATDKALREARAAATVRRFNLDGSPMTGPGSTAPTFVKSSD